MPVASKINVTEKIMCRIRCLKIRDHRADHSFERNEDLSFGCYVASLHVFASGEADAGSGGDQPARNSPIDRGVGADQ
jgi:hypothetical protein